MTTSYYDVVVLGAKLPALLTAALLAKRDFRVLVLGQGDPPCTYDAGLRTLPRAPFTLVSHGSPIVRRVLHELALPPILRRRLSRAEPSLQIAMPGVRLDLSSDDARTLAEIEREYPEVRRPVDDFLGAASRAATDLDRVLERELVWPPTSFLERREFARLTSTTWFGADGESPDPLLDFPDDHRFPAAARLPARFLADADASALPPVAIARAFTSWTRHAVAVEGGYAWLDRALRERIETHGGRIEARERADRILVKRQAAVGVRLAASGAEVGCGTVVAAIELARVLRLVPDRSVFEDFLDRHGQPEPSERRYTLNVVVRATHVPEGMGRDVLALVERPSGARTLRIEAQPTDPSGHRLITVETLVPTEEVEGREALPHLREDTLDALGHVMPFLDRGLVFFDSPHDGLPPDQVNGRAVEATSPHERGPRTMEAIHRYPTRGALGVSGLPVRTSLRRVLLASPDVAPGLGQEGAFLAAWSGARTVTASDRRRQWMRRGLFTKVDL